MQRQTLSPVKDLRDLLEGMSVSGMGGMSGMHWTTLITTADYAEGVVCLALSLQLVKSRAPLLCYVPSPAIEAAILSAMHTHRSNLSIPVSNLIVRLIPSACTESDDAFRTNVCRDGGEFIDAARRFLFLMGEPFIFLDADMIVIRNIDDLLEHIVIRNISPGGVGDGGVEGVGAVGVGVGVGVGVDVGVGAEEGRILAVPNFRNKRRGYGGGEGNFNAGLMVVPQPCRGDYEGMMGMLRGGYADTEEKLLNEVGSMHLSTTTYLSMCL
jgi:hypothetical protein